MSTSALRVMVIDDEPPARRDLIRLLAADPLVTIVGEHGSIAAAEQVLAGLAPDVVFLDLRLGERIGFELLPAVPEGTAVVIVTAYDEYALRAFETNALDYLLKPVEAPRLALTLARIRGRAACAVGRAALPARIAVNDWLLVRDGGREEFIRASSIACVMADGDYTRVGTIDGRTRLVHRSLREWEARLPTDTFERVHRAAIVNLRHVAAVDRAMTRAPRLTVRGHGPITISRRAAARMRRTHG